MTFGSYCTSVLEKFNIYINVTKINRVESTKYLGIIIDYKLCWDKHIEYILNKTKYLIFIFYKLSKIMNEQSLRILNLTVLLVTG